MRLGPTILLLGGATLATAAVALARADATADLAVKWFPVQSPPLTGRPFNVRLSLFNNGPDASSARINIRVPEGVREVSSQLSCTDDGLVKHCDEVPAPVGDDGSGGISFVAAQPGGYTFVVFLDHVAAADPDPSNNTDSLTVQVAAAPHALAAGAVSIVPAHPRAGSSVVVSFGVRDTTAGSAVAVTSARCRAAPGSARARVVGGRATCAVHTPLRARGALLRGTLTATVGGRRFTRRFSVRLR